MISAVRAGAGQKVFSRLPALCGQLPRALSVRSSVGLGPQGASARYLSSKNEEVTQTIKLTMPSGMSQSQPSVSRPLIPRPQDKAPFFRGQAVINRTFKEISLDDFKGKWLVLFFYPLDFTFVCPTEIIAYSDRQKEFKDLQCEVVACSTDSHFSHLAWINMPRKEGGLGEMKIPVLSDFNKVISEDYGVLLPQLGGALRGLFLIDPDGVIKHVSVNDLPVGRSVDETLRLVKAFQFVSKHGEVCPANWTPESPTIKPNPTDSQEYFTKVNK